ncbi:S-adenosyl-L-methionine-dependent methyltransferase [Aspergillus eucalypticola CBS 122712]|uniref:S-adenosyl-L-methionine-dependent methyltransferase n=1 Tax=Aspergillus eucalypticola (strain CBS 122712 / IBT 29274) TaxID=1448314 RepID=A0A317WE68_ASPEC|nr:S-adenosyl-L-methionine-dependent methyltransferase [Aspergillus eucalypticola CBS 122712]PWY82520.1 S-adenosyl-L-methionine-dependent methyltransferase [Aspergillus eucalypticola CBS 122712]
MTSEIGRLASIISRAAATIEVSLTERGDFPEASAVGSGSKEVLAAKADAIDACMELLDQLQGPSKCMIPLWNGASLQAISRHHIANHVPIHGEISYQDLARASGVPVNELKQYIRFAIIHHRLFIEKRNGYVSHSAGSRSLLEDPGAIAGVSQLDEWYSAFSRTVDAMDQFPGHKPNETGYALSHGNQSIFDYLSDRPAKAKQFADAMQFYTVAIPEASPSFFLQGYPWGDLPRGSVVVDVGGSDGHVGRLIAQRYQHINVVVQDLEYAAADFQAAAKEDRNIRFDAHDFFSPQTVVADVYLFRWVLMNWADEYVVRILQQLVPSLRPGAKVLVNESLCPESGSLPLATERYIRWMDLLMLGVYKSRLRDKEDWDALFKQADAGFDSFQCSMVPGSAMGIVQAIWRGN